MADVVNAEPGQEVEILPAVVAKEPRALGPDEAAAEAEGFEQPDVAGVDELAPEGVGFVAVCTEHGTNPIR